MSRDTKPRQRASETRKRSGGGTLLGLFVGLVAGVLIAAGVVWYIHRTPPPFAARTPPPTNAPQPGQAPLALPGKPGDPIPRQSDKPRFDFYKILPGNGETASEPGTATAKPSEPKPPDAGREQNAQNTLREPVFLQTGSFQNADDADNQKARLAMAGIEAAVQQVMLQDKVWYRVRLGPFRRIEEVNALRADLARQGIEANVVRKD
ncbi:MAG: SPOR domain-containing protein [Candidatus Accumulibacter sp.]|jgi:cell division protein FtsN|nr:SPOR domain-containing protein [Accumulibacter sp.]